MIKICRGLYINPLTVVFFAVCFLNGKISFFLISYISMIIHELMHLTAACFIGLRPLRVSFHPFGVNLRLKSNMVCGMADDIILYASGPLSNLVLSFVFIKVLGCEYGFAVNIMLFAVNFLPICPLDGGCVAKRILSEVFSLRAANIIMKSVSALLALTALPAGIYLVYITGYNYSVIFISVLLFANIFTSAEKYPESAIRNLIYSSHILKNKNGRPVRLYTAEENFSPAYYLNRMRRGVVTYVAVEDSDGKIKKIVSEKEIIKMLDVC